MMRIAAMTMLLAAPAYAQDPPLEPPPERARPAGGEGWSVTIGAAPVLTPAWQGSKQVSLSIFPDLRIAYGDALFASVPEGIGWNAIRADGWRVGPLVKLRFGRNERNGGSPFLITGGSDALFGMGNVKAAGEAGGFVEKAFGPGDRIRLRAELRQGFGGHRGAVADVSATYRARVGRAILSAGPRATAATGDFMQTYFGIDAGQSARTGLDRYDADGGLLSWGVGGTVVRPLDRRSAITLFTSLERLAGPAADSPLIRERGQATQFTLGIGYGFRFGL
ncbi:MAG: MipA/OmpV family protein [Sphingomonas sp.]